MDSEKTPREIRSVFRNNLAYLTQNEPSISGLSKKIGITRTLLARFLSGESTPRPEALAAICDYFNVDARIMLEPIQDKERDRFRAWKSKVADMLFLPNHVPASDRSLPNGFYIEWRPSFVRADEVTGNIYWVHGEGSNKLISGKGFNQRPQFDFLEILSIKTRWNAVAIRQNYGFCVIDRFEDFPTLAFTIIWPGYRFDQGAFVGHKLKANINQPQQQAVSCPVFIEPLGPKLSDIKQGYRQCYEKFGRGVPDYVLEYLSNAKASPE